jgi:Protein of unknown function (DUF3551)
MKLFLFALSVTAALAGFAPTVKAQNYPWCARMDLGDMVENCGFESLEQCKASLTGVHDWCAENNTYKPPPAETVGAEDTSAPAQVPLPAAKKAQRHSSRSPAQGAGPNH